MKRLAYLDALRGIAALMVVLTHLYLPVVGHVWVFDYLIDPGKLGVLWFFMISGVVIPYSLKPGPDGAQRFLVSRFMRLYPAYWLSLLVFIVILKLTGAPLPSLAQIAANLTMVQAALGFDDVIGLYWTLFIELVFYALCLALFLGGKLYDQTFRTRCSLAFLVMALAMGVMRALTERKLPVALPLALSLMFFGSVWRQWLLAEHSNELTRNLKTLLIAFTVVLPPTLFMAYSKDMGNGETWGRYCFTYAVAISSFLVLTRSVRLDHPALVWLGAVSYSLYLLHPSMGMLAEWLLNNTGASALVIALFATLLTLGASHLSFHFVESPFIQLGKRLNNRKARTQPVNA
ncbi:MULTISPECIES: acyltransferase [unclassified Pseudomonas]|uniref:acyltransferase family protein n=1 Tax=unclassified Pseudomonas TaxID=196821 RepID=UPI000D3D4529|nr:MULTISPECIES: acyltransferase [unclassified Pseudomonas]RAU47314.1 acyltransferase [Pseudomonas sp. RIT 409]RAU52012.1 acyltransferase [Pseudomonas sp. RIT 412]